MMIEWVEKYLKNAHKRLQRQIDGFELTIEDVYIMQPDPAGTCAAIYMKGTRGACCLFAPLTSALAPADGQG